MFCLLHEQHAAAAVDWEQRPFAGNEGLAFGFFLIFKGEGMARLILHAECAVVGEDADDGAARGQRQRRVQAAAGWRTSGYSRTVKLPKSSVIHFPSCKFA